MLPAVGLGTAQVFNTNDEATRQKAAAVLQALIAGGGRLVDTSSVYGEAETVLGQVTTSGGLRQKLSSPPTGVARRRGAQTITGPIADDAIDLLQFHNVRDPQQSLAQFKNGPPTIRRLSRRLSKILMPWQTLVITLLYLYIARNLGKLLGLECPEPLANLYTRSYFRATWVTTALDAGFGTAMRIRKKWLRDFCSIAFSIYYLIAAEQADEKVRKVRGALTLDHLRVSLETKAQHLIWPLHLLCCGHV